MTIADNIKKIRKKIGTDITLVAASKTRSVETIKVAKDAGAEIFGENRVQEFLGKYGKVDVCWHYIGRLQTNKVKYIIGKVDLIHSVDSIKLLDEIERQAAKLAVRQKILIEVSIANEEQKGGVATQSLEDILIYAANLSHISVCGLMAVMPLCENVQDNEKYYLKIKAIYDRIRETELVDNKVFNILSVGMSNDYEIAVACGSNMVRVGTAIFGKREYQIQG